MKTVTDKYDDDANAGWREAIEYWEEQVRYSTGMRDYFWNQLDDHGYPNYSEEESESHDLH